MSEDLMSVGRFVLGQNLPVHQNTKQVCCSESKRSFDPIFCGNATGDFALIRCLIDATDVACATAQLCLFCLIFTCGLGDPGQRGLGLGPAAEAVHKIVRA